MSTDSRNDDRSGLSVVGMLALIVALVVALLGAWSARPDEPERDEARVRVRVGVFERARLDAGVEGDLRRALAAIGGDSRFAWIGERAAAPEWRADGVEVVDVTDAIRARLAATARGGK